MWGYAEQPEGVALDDATKLFARDRGQVCAVNKVVDAVEVFDAV